LDRNRSELREAPTRCVPPNPIAGILILYSFLYCRSCKPFLAVVVPVGMWLTLFVALSPYPQDGAPACLERRQIIQSLERPLVVVEFQPRADPTPRLGDRAIRLQKYLLIFQAPPEPLDEHVVQVPARHHGLTMTISMNRFPINIRYCLAYLVPLAIFHLTWVKIKLCRGMLES
jgi:hypothetical protein